MPTTTATELVMLAPAEIKTHPLNPRTDLGDLTELAASIKENGVQEPVHVAPRPKAPGKYVLIDGHRRRAAAIRAGVQVPALVRHDLDTDVLQLEAMVTAGTHSVPLTPLEEADAYRQLSLLDVPVNRIAKASGRKVATVRDRIRLADSPAEVRASITAGLCTLDQALELARFDDDNEAWENLSRALGTSTWAYALQREKDKRAAATAYEHSLSNAQRMKLRLVTEDDDDYEHAVLVSDLPGTYSLNGHESCPGAAVMLTRARPESLQAVCLTAGIHDAPSTGEQERPAPATGLTPDDDGLGEFTPPQRTDAEQAVLDARAREREERKDRKAAREALAAELATAATVRRTYLRVLAEDGEHDVARRLLLEVLYGQLDDPVRPEHAVLLNVEPGATREEQEQSLTGKPLETLAILAWLLDHDYVERAMADADRWNPAGMGTPHEHYIRTVGGQLGYEWSPVEGPLVDAVLAPPAGG